MVNLTIIERGLFTAPLFKLFSNEKKEIGISIRGYVDDGLLTARNKSVQTGVSKIAIAFEKVEQWAYDNGMIFDPAKFEAIHFPRKHNLLNLDIELPAPPFAQDSRIPRIVKPTAKDSSMRWLGVYFDARLSFKRHVEKMASKARKAVAGLNILGNTVQGVETKVMRRAVHACILHILTYAAPAWWPGRTRLNKQGKTVQNGVEGQLKRLDKLQNIALRSILPVWRTTPIQIMQREAAAAPVEYALNHLCELASLRLHKLEPRHPLRLRTKKVHTSIKPTRLERLAKICPTFTQYSNPILEPEPWEQQLFGGAMEYTTATGGTANKKKAAENFNQWLSERSPDEMLIYTDGSQKLDKAGKILGTGTAWTVEWKGQWLGTNGCSLGAKAEVYDAEAIGLCGGLEAALASPMAGLSSAVHICTNNLNIAKEAGSVPNGSSQAAFIRFREGVKSWHQKGKKVSVQWVPSHMGIIGNKRANQEAKKQAASPITEAIQTLAHARRVVREKKDQAWQKEWGSKTTSQSIKIYQELKISPTNKCQIYARDELE